MIDRAMGHHTLGTVDPCLRELGTGAKVSFRGGPCMVADLQASADNRRRTPAMLNLGDGRDEKLCGNG